MVRRSPDGETDRAKLTFLTHSFEFADRAVRRQDRVHVDGVGSVDLHEVHRPHAEDLQTLLDRPAGRSGRVVPGSLRMHANLGAEMERSGTPAEREERLA